MSKGEYRGKKEEPVRKFVRPAAAGIVGWGSRRLGYRPFPATGFVAVCGFVFYGWKVSLLLLGRPGLMERGTGIEPVTSSLGSWRSTAELTPLTSRVLSQETTTRISASTTVGAEVKVAPSQRFHAEPPRPRSGPLETDLKSCVFA
jgi:hypothetical protein